MGKVIALRHNKLWLLLLLGLICLPAATAGAHARSIRSTPPDGARLKEPPAQVQLWFSEPLVEELAKIQLVDKAGNQVDGVTRTMAAKDSVLLALPPLAAGDYRVVYKVVSVDTHTTEGTIRFSVATGAPGATLPGAAAPGTLPVDPQTARPGLPWLWAGLVGGLAVSVLAVLLLRARVRRRP